MPDGRLSQEEHLDLNRRHRRMIAIRKLNDAIEEIWNYALTVPPGHEDHNKVMNAYDAICQVKVE